jgi:hypothetical protein
MSSKRKQIGRVNGPETQNAIDAANRDLPTSIAIRRTRTLLADLRSDVVGEYSKIAARVIKKEITPEQAAADARRVLVEPVMVAAGRGAALTGLRGWNFADEQVDSLWDLIEAEVEFWQAFMTELADEQANTNARIGLYGGVVGDAMWRGMAMSAPSNAVIHWRLSVAEHCADCLRLAAGSPYSPPGIGANPLPTVPRNGDTRCLGNCRCYLNITSPFDAGLFNKIGVEVTAIGTAEISPTSPAALAAAELYLDLAERRAYHIRLSQLEPGSGHSAIAATYKREMEDLARRLGHTIRMRASYTEIIDQIQLAVAIGLQYVSAADISDDLVEAVATVLAMNESKRGIIREVRIDPPAIVLDDDHEYRLDSVGRNILFVE